MSKHPAPRELTASIELPAGPGPLQRAAKAAVLPWIALWGWVAVDSALTYRKSREAIDHAIEADPIATKKARRVSSAQIAKIQEQSEEDPFK